MTLSATLLSADIVTKIKAIPGITISKDAELESFADAIAEAVIEHFLANAVPIGSVVVPSGSSAGTYPLTLSSLT